MRLGKISPAHAYLLSLGWKHRKWGDDGRDLRNQALDVERSPADVIDRLVVKKNNHIRVLQKRVGGGGDLRRRVHGEPQLRLIAVVHGETLEEKSAKARDCASTNSIENEESLKASAVVRELPDAIKAEVDNFLANCRNIDAIMGILVCLRSAASSHHCFRSYFQLRSIRSPLPQPMVTTRCLLVLPSHRRLHPSAEANGTHRSTPTGQPKLEL
ncbi:hypothetical protein B296_00017572 [Ensete ventricosum]|uniref:Uncharacterized protein n=1 Tax=Ensete ventricosum TaxID=4639 RepID=A0A427B4R5_ENSVE|nr:hypothetical protein B296_00017572 [Ensete ventricosum]